MSGRAAHGERVRLAIHVRPGERRVSADGEVGGEYAGRLVVRVREPAVDGRATAAALAAVAAALGVPRSAVSLVSGAGSREKLVEIVGIDQSVLDRVAELRTSGRRQ